MDELTKRFIDSYEYLKKTNRIKNDTDFAQNLDVSRSMVTEILKGRSKPGTKALQNIVKHYSIDGNWLLADAGDMIKQYDYSDNPLELNEPTTMYMLRTDKPVSTQSIPLYNTQAAASLTKTFSDPPNVIDHISIPNLPKCDGAIYITGDSMYPLLKSGDIIAYKKINDIQNGILWGEMYVLSFLMDDDDDFTTVKFIQKSEKGENYVKLVSQNQHHQPKDIPMKDITALALIKASIRFNSMN